MPKTLTTADFINRANKIHNNFYDYSHVVYTNMHTKVKIIDLELGEFWQAPMGHLQGQGHPGRRYTKMANKRRKPMAVFIQQAREKHGNLYDYSKVVYTTVDTKVCITDPEYGEFWQSPYQHLNSHGCPARTAEKKWEIHYDHIIPLSILNTANRSFNKWYIDRPLYEFLNSEINLKLVSAKFNCDKSDFVTVNGKKVSASSVRNNYNVIAHLISKLLSIDPAEIIKKDQQFVNNYFGI
jgi:hypothetical protein